MTDEYGKKQAQASGRRKITAEMKVLGHVFSAWPRRVIV